LAQGVKVPIFRVRDRDRPLLTNDFAEIPSRYAFTLMIPQHKVANCGPQLISGRGSKSNLSKEH
jgi:hypothetical protein